jgi:hypothetical protein
MTVPPDDATPDSGDSARSGEPAEPREPGKPESEAGGTREPIPGVDFDPYRFGKPDYPIAPEYAPPGYRPMQPPQPPPQPPTSQQPPGWPPPGPAQPFRYTPGPPGPGQPPPGRPAPPFSPYGTSRPTNSKATASLVLGILAIVLSWLLIWDLLLIIPAIVIGVGARKDAARFPERGGRNAATAGIVCGIVAAVLVVAFGIYAYTRVKPCLDEFSVGSKQFQTCATDRLF